MASVLASIRHLAARVIMPRRPATRDAATGKRAASPAPEPPAKKGKTAAPTSPPAKKKTIKPARQPRAHTPAALVRAERIADVLADLFPDPQPPLDFENDVQLLIAVLLSAQTTDVKVNEATKSLFAAAPDAAALAALGAAGIEPHIKTLGLAPTKAKNVAATAAILEENHGGRVPLDWDALHALPGVGHKTASVIMAMAGPGQRAFPVDTHIHRLAERWGLSNGSSVEQTEADLKAAFSAPRHDWGKLHLRFIFAGRAFCPARGHDPKTCAVCSWVNKK